VFLTSPVVKEIEPAIASIISLFFASDLRYLIATYLPKLSFRELIW